MFFNCYLSIKIRLLNEVSVATWFCKGGIRLSWFYTILKFIKIKFDENLTVWFNGPLLFLQVCHTKISMEEIPQLSIFSQFPVFWGFLQTLPGAQPESFEGRGGFCKLGHKFLAVKCKSKLKSKSKSKLNVSIKVRFFQK